MSVGLSIITNNPENAKRVVRKYGQHYDVIYITVGAPTREPYYDMQKVGDDKIMLSYHKTSRKPEELDFAAIRNTNLKTIETDYWMWLDDDDEVENIERLPEVIKYMQVNDLDVVQLKYDYAHNDIGDAISDHWRERIIRTKYHAKWDAPVHETLQSVVPARIERLDWMVVRHQKDVSSLQSSMARNEQILRHHYDKTKDPRDASYLGMTVMARKQYPQAIDWFVKHIDASGSNEDKYRSWCRIADCEWLLGNYEQALYATDEAIKLLPSFPDAYYIKTLIYTNTEEYQKGIEWLKVAMSKPMPDTLSMVDPTLYEYRGMAMGAMCYLFSGRVKEAFRLYNAVIERAPDFYKQMNEIDGVDWPAEYERAYFDQRAIDYTRFLLHYLGTNQGDPIKLLQSLSPRLLADVRLNADRAKFLPKTTWPNKSIVFYCGQTGEAWGPDTLSKGMGGSEEAVIYLTRELAKLGWQVTVFNDREEEYRDGFIHAKGDATLEKSYVTYKPWTLLNPDDHFDVFVAWRSPEVLRGIKANKLVLDLHDVVQPERIYALDKDVKIMVKSQYHRDLYPELPDNRFVIVGNAIVKEQFDEAKTLSRVL